MRRTNRKSADPNSARRLPCCRNNAFHSREAQNPWYQREFAPCFSGNNWESVGENCSVIAAIVTDHTANRLEGIAKNPLISA
jgi:hypothetical protein